MQMDSCRGGLWLPHYQVCYLCAGCPDGVGAKATDFSFYMVGKAGGGLAIVNLRGMGEFPDVACVAIP